MKGVFTIGIDRRFADELAQGVLAEHGGDPLALADVLILVPTMQLVAIGCYALAARRYRRDIIEEPEQVHLAN